MIYGQNQIDALRNYYASMNPGQGPMGPYAHAGDPGLSPAAQGMQQRFGARQVSPQVQALAQQYLSNQMMQNHIANYNPNGGMAVGPSPQIQPSTDPQQLQNLWQQMQASYGSHVIPYNNPTAGGIPAGPPPQGAQPQPLMPTAANPATPNSVPAPQVNPMQQPAQPPIPMYPMPQPQVANAPGGGAMGLARYYMR